MSAGDIRRGRRRRWGRFLREFATVPLLVVLAFCALAVVCIVADQTRSVGPLNDARSAVAGIVGKQTATATLQAIATGLLTVASITFSMLLLAVQQSASSLSPVVLDQFIRRRSNQAFLGFFVGLALLAYVVMAAVQRGTPPVLGAAVAIVLTVVALLILLTLVYSSVAQMRPANVVGAIHDRTLAARDEEADLIRRTRRTSASPHQVAALYRSQVTGYLTHLDLDRLERALRDAEDAEICIEVSLGDHISYGDIVAKVLDGEVDRAEEIAKEVAAALTVSRRRDLAHDSTTGIDQLGNIAWSNGSTAKQNPEVAREALHALEDLAARWVVDDPADRPADDAEVTAIVYREHAVDRLLAVFYSLLVVAHESHQHTLAVSVLHGYHHLLERASDQVARRLCDDLSCAQGLIDAMPPSPQLRRAWDALEDAVAARIGRGTDDRSSASVRSDPIGAQGTR